jgi:membrane-associated phospholipid phosphatase
MQVNFHDFFRHLRTLLSDFYSSYRSYIGLILGVVIGLVVCGLLINGFFQLLDELTDNELGRFDDSVALPIHEMRTPGLTDVMLVITWVGDQTAYIIFAVSLFIFFYLRYRSLIFPLQTSMVLLIAGGLNRWLKGLIDRPRPEAQHLVEAGSLSFPSGHAMSSIAFFGFLIYLVWRLISTLWVRWLLSLLLALLILLIGFSRVYLGVHYPSDILAGYAAGGACLAVFISIFTYVRYRYARKGKEPQVTADEQA